MLFHPHVLRTLLGAANAVGLTTAEILEPLGLAEASLTADEPHVAWTTVVAVMDRVSRLLGGDAERLREVGRSMLGEVSLGNFRRLARSTMSIRDLYALAGKGQATAMFPHLPLETSFPRAGQVALHAEVPAQYAGSEPLFHIFTGTVCALPTQIGLPPARLLECTITDRSADLLIAVPRARSPRAPRRLRARIAARTLTKLVAEQRRRLAATSPVLQTATNDFRALLDSLPDLVVVHRAGQLLWVNTAFVESLGFKSLSEMVGRPLLSLVAPRDQAMVRERMAAATRVPLGAARTMTETTLVTREGKELIVEVAPAQTVVFEGLEARLLVGRNVTERVEMHQRLIVADRLASIGLLAAGVAHEVNNPLAYVLNNIEIAQRALAPVDAPPVEIARSVLDVALEGVDRIRVIVRELLRLSRGDEGPADDLDVRRVLESILVLAAREIERTAQLVREFDPNAPTITASSARVAQVLLNLIGNALESMRDGSRETNVLTVRVGPSSDGRLRIEVSDTGRGIPASDLKRVFEPFYTTKPAGQGTGLGLAIAQRLIVDMGGEIDVVSELGAGTTFRVHLPPKPDDGD